jgi:hypothetical protein
MFSCTFERKSCVKPQQSMTFRSAAAQARFGYRAGKPVRHSNPGNPKKSS